MTKVQDDYASLLSRASSGPAQSLVERLFQQAVALENKAGRRKNRRGAATATPYREALERFLGDLLRAQADHLHPPDSDDSADHSSGRIYRSMNKSSFTGDIVGYRNFDALVRALTALKMIEHKPGKGRYLDAFGVKVSLLGKAARFTATPKLFKVAGEAGVELAAIDDHFRLEPPRDPLVLRASSVRLGREKLIGTRVKYPTSLRTEELENQVRRLNDFLKGFRLSGGIHYGYFRLFNEGDDPDNYAWNKGGRLYSLSARSYQQLSGDERARMTINGEPVCEIDVAASNLTIFHAKLDAPFDTSRDPYERVSLELDKRPELARNIVKAWITASIGKGAPVDKWPAKANATFHKAHGETLSSICTAKAVRDPVLEVYPALEHLGELGVQWADLMFLESESIISTMVHLMQLGVPSLSMHDSIIVPVRQVSNATVLLKNYYTKHAGVKPRLATKSHLPGMKELVATAQHGP